MPKYRDLLAPLERQLSRSIDLSKRTDRLLAQRMLSASELSVLLDAFDAYVGRPVHAQVRDLVLGGRSAINQDARIRPGIRRLSRRKLEHLAFNSLLQLLNSDPLVRNTAARIGLAAILDTTVGKPQPDPTYEDLLAELAEKRKDNRRLAAALQSVAAVLPTTERDERTRTPEFIASAAVAYIGALQDTVEGLKPCEE